MRRILLLTVLMSCSGTVACGDTTTEGDAVGVTGDIVIFAASSLTEAFTEMGDAFTAANPGTHVTFSFAGAGDLVAQISEGAPADVFASSDDASMQRLLDAGANATQPVVVARNTFAILVGPGNPHGVTGLADLADSDLIVVLCADTVPCGKGAMAVLANAGVSVSPASYEDKVKSVVAKVVEGEADGGIVFATDVQAAGADAVGIAIPADVNVITDYPIVVTNEATNAAGAQAFIDFVAGPTGQAILAKYGFLAP